MPRRGDGELREAVEPLRALRLEKVGGSKSSTSPAMWLRNGDGSNRVISRTAERCARSPDHSPSRVMPIGVIAPIPVITTLRLFRYMRLPS